MRRYDGSAIAEECIQGGGYAWGTVTSQQGEGGATGTGGGDNLYQGYYIQLIKSLGSREFADATENVEDTQSSDPWIDWVRIQDYNGDGYRDVVVDDVAVGVIWLNDGSGRFQRGSPTNSTRQVRVRLCAVGRCDPDPIARCQEANESRGLRAKTLGTSKLRVVGRYCQVNWSRSSRFFARIDQAVVTRL